jgi:TRAP-type mannitol/chloroaromatic compound transport system permease small subunit
VKMEKVLRFIDRMSIWTGKLSSFLVVALTLAMTYDILMRYLFNRPNFWAYDMTIMLYGSYSLLGAAYCHYHKQHVSMDLVYSRQSPRTKAIIDVICYLILFFPLLLVLTYMCGKHAVWSVLYGERASGSSWRPYLGPFKLLISFGFLMLLFQGVADFVRSCVVAFRGGSNEP